MIKVMENQNQYIIKTEDGGRLSFKSMLEISVNEASRIAAEPIEKNSFAMYNRIVEPVSVKIRLGTEGEKEELQKILNDLSRLKTSNTKVSIILPSSTYENYMLESFDWRKDDHTGADVLLIDCQFVEVREVADQKTTTTVTEPPPITEEDAADGSYASTVDGGEVQGYDPSDAEEEAAGGKRKSIAKEVRDYFGI